MTTSDPISPKPKPPTAPGQQIGMTGTPKSILRAFLRGLCGSGNHSNRDPLGPEGERLAAEHLKAKGYRIIGSNVRVRGGEADLIAIDPDQRTIVLVEVKSRRTDPRATRPAFAAPELSVHAIKQRKLRRILRELVRANRWHDRPQRIDVVAVEVPHPSANLSATVRHLPGSVDLNGPA